MKIVDLSAREILDSNGHPTIETEITLEDGVKALGQVPSGASTGSFEAVEIRDEDGSRYDGLGVLKAVENVRSLKDVLIGQDAYDQSSIDELLCKTDGTENKSRLGGNAILSISMAVCRSAARSKKIPLFNYFGLLSDNDQLSLPQPQILMMEGGKHGNWSTDIQEYMIMPKIEVYTSFSEMLRVGAEIYYSLGSALEKRGYGTGVGYEGAYCPDDNKSNEGALNLIMQAIEDAGYKYGEEVELAIDVAANEFFEDGKYLLKSENNQKLEAGSWVDKIVGWTKQYPLRSVEDPLGEEEWEAWSKFTLAAGDKIQVVGDDLLTTNPNRIQRAVDEKAANAVIIKLNQIGTVTETIEAIKVADSAGFVCIVSHRSGETNDDMIADLAVGTVASQCKFGSPVRGERVAKYNRLLRIEEQLSR